MKLYGKIQSIRVELQSLNLKKSGHNKFANFHYYKLEDFLPSLNGLCLKHQVITIFQLNNDAATLTIADDESSLVFSMPYEKPEIKGANIIQNLGGAVTYLRRYLFLTAFEICEDDELDATIGKKEESKPITASSNSFDYAKDIIENCDTIERLEQVRLQLLVKKWSVADAANLKAIIEKTRGKLNGK